MGGVLVGSGFRPIVTVLGSVPSFGPRGATLLCSARSQHPVHDLIDEVMNRCPESDLEDRGGVEASYRSER